MMIAVEAAYFFRSELPIALGSMANTIISLSQIRQIIRMYMQGVSKLSIAVRTGVSRNTAKKYIQAFKDTGFTFEELNELNDIELE